ncbi:MAG: hypothetical protein ACE5HJ_04000 [Thermoplasmata archaeon]
MSLSKPRALKQDDSGVASTVGTIMALLVVLTFMSLIVNQYVPVWGKEAEASHMNTVLGQFGSFKSSVDTQVVSAQVSATSGSTYIPTEAYSPIQLGTDGVPVFSSPTVGRLDGSGDEGLWTAQFTYAIEGSVYTVNQSASGNVVLRVENRYHVPVTIAYEGGAIIVQQTGGEAVRVAPQFVVLNTTNGAEVALTLVQLIGSGNVAGSGTEGIRSKLLGLDMQVFTSIQTSLWINHTTLFGPAWFRYLNSTLSLAFGVLESDFSTAGYQYFESPSGQTVTTPFYVLTRSQSGLQHNVSLEIIHDPSVGRSITKLTLNQAFVSIAIGRSGSTLEV